MSFVLKRGLAGASSGTIIRQTPGKRPRPGSGGPATMPVPGCGGPGQAPCVGGSGGGGGVASGNYIMANPAQQQDTMGALGATAGGIIGSIIDVATSRAGSLIIAGTLTYLLIKSPAARKELGLTAKGQYHKARARLGRKRGHGMVGIGPSD